MNSFNNIFKFIWMFSSIFLSSCGFKAYHELPTHNFVIPEAIGKPFYKKKLEQDRSAYQIKISNQLSQRVFYAEVPPFQDEIRTDETNIFLAYLFGGEFNLSILKKLDIGIDINSMMSGFVVNYQIWGGTQNESLTHDNQYKISIWTKNISGRDLKMQTDNEEKSRKMTSNNTGHQFGLIAGKRIDNKNLLYINLFTTEIKSSLTAEFTNSILEYQGKAKQQSIVLGLKRKRNEKNQDSIHYELGYHRGGHESASLGYNNNLDKNYLSLGIAISN